MEIVGGLVMFRVSGAGKGRSTSGLFELHMAARVAILVWLMEQNSADLYINEGFRPTGVPSDADVYLPFQTSAGISTQWFQVGRMWRGETPSAIVPNASGSNLSKHRTGEALDSNAPTLRDFMFRAQGAYLAGLVFNVASESWHCEPLAVPQTDLGPWVATVQGVVTPAKPTPPKNLKKESTTMTRMFREVGNKGQIFVIGGGGAGYIKHPDHVAEIAEMNRISGLTGPSWSEPANVPWQYITHLSESLQEGSLAAATLAETRSLTGTEKKPGILKRIAAAIKTA